MSAVTTSHPSAASKQRSVLARVMGLAAIVVLSGLLAVFVLAPSRIAQGPVAWVIVAGQSMEPTMLSGDIAFVHRRSTYDVGDVIAYRVPEGEPGAGVIVIHRIVGGSADKGYLTRGDNTTGRDAWQPKADEIIGVEFFTIPRVGLVVPLLRSPLGLALLAGCVASAIAFGSEPRQRPGRRPWRRRAGPKTPSSSR